MDNAQFPRTGMVVEPPLGFVSQASGVARSNAPSPALANPTDAVAEAARRVHEGEASAIDKAIEALQRSIADLINDSSTYVLQLVQRKDKHIEELTAAATALGRDGKEFSAKLRAEGEAVLESIRSKTAHVQECSAAIRSHLSPTQES